jgi:DNA-binding NarL/FixJ family response regulator
VLVVDNDPFTLTSMVNALEHSEIVVAGSATTAREALAVQVEVQADVALLDLDLGIGPNGIDLAHALRVHAPEIGLVLLSTFRDPRLLSPRILHPPRGMSYLSKGDIGDFSLIANQVRAAAVAPLRARPNGTLELTKLSTGQLEVLNLLAQGWSTQAIADSRGISVKAVEQRISRLSEILGVARDGSTNQRVILTLAYLELAGKIDGNVTE